jgi:hypothetical protein
MQSDVRSRNFHFRQSKNNGDRFQKNFAHTIREFIANTRDRAAPEKNRLAFHSDVRAR